MRYLTTVYGIDLANCLRIYRDKHSATYWLVTADLEWKETKTNVGPLDLDIMRVVRAACHYNQTCREFILKNRSLFQP